MFIYTVKPGDSLFAISSKYNLSEDRIRLANGLNQTNIVPGQSLLIPSYTYTVQPGDTMTLIANMAYVPLEQLTAANPNVNPNDLQPGTKIKIPNIANYSASTLGYYTVKNPEQDQTFINDFAPYHTYMALFEYHFSSDGNFANNLNDAKAIQTCWQRHVHPLMTVTNLTSQGFSAELAHEMLNNPGARTNLINTIFNFVSNKGYAGVNIDIEGISSGDRDLFTGFLSQLRDRLKPSGYSLTIAVPPKTSENVPWLLGYDYGGIGSVVDLMFIMAYDWHHGSSEPGPVAPINEVRQTLSYALTKTRRYKIMLGVPLYGYNWKLPYNPNTIAPGIANQSAIELAMRYQVPIQYSTEYQTPSFQYTDEQGQRHVVWFEDSRSMSEKLLLVREFGLVGTGAWQLSLGFTPGVWLLTNFFTIRRV